MRMLGKFTVKLGDVSIVPEPTKPPKIGLFSLAKVFLYFHCLSSDIKNNVIGFLLEYPEQEEIHKDHRSLASKRSIPWMLLPALSDTNSTLN